MAAEARRDAEGRDRILAIADSLAEQGKAPATASEESVGWIAFHLAGRAFALPVSHVRGVHRAGHVTPLPNSPSAVRGLTNLRGRVIAVIDLAAQLELGATEIDERSRILEAEIGRRRLGLLTERTDSLIKVRPGDVEPVADETPLARWAAGEIETRAGRVVLLDPEQLLEGSEAASAGAAEVRKKP